MVSCPRCLPRRWTIIGGDRYDELEHLAEIGASVSGAYDEPI